MFELEIEDLNLDHLASAKHFHLSSAFLQRKLFPDIPSLIRETKQRGLANFLDPNDDPEGKWDGLLENVVPLVDVLFCTEEELQNLAKVEDAEGFVEARVPLLVVKR